MTRLKTALIGVGAWGRVLAKAASESKKIEFSCCVGRDPKRLSSFSRDTGIPTRKVDDALSDKNIAAVALALPNELHFELAYRAAKAGKHVYIEKPIANTMSDALAIAALEQAYGVRIVVGHCARLLSGIRSIRAAIDAGMLGKVSQLEATFSNDRGLRLTPQDWRWYRQNAPGGSLSQIAIHQFDVLRYLGGDISAVSASARRHSPVGAEVDDQWIVAVHFADGKLGTVCSNWTSPGVFSVRVIGSDALMFYEIDQTHWALADQLHHMATLYFQARGKGPAERQVIPVSPGNMYRDELELFAVSVQTCTACDLSAENGCQALAAVYGALRSAHEESRAIPLRQVIEGAGTQRGPAGETKRHTLA